MPTLLWDEAGTRVYESGIDRGVLYLSDGAGVVWNGLISVNEIVEENEISPTYFDGVKITEIVVPGNFAATMTAFTYPDEFLEFEGTVDIGNGLFATNQRQKRFGLSYRTMIDSDSDVQHYKIHILYNLLAVPSQKNYQTLSNSPNPIEFEWNLSAIPGEINGYRPSAHLIIDTRYMSPDLVRDIEGTLYGEGINSAVLPEIITLTNFISNWVIIRIVDNLDGTWTAIGPDTRITMLDATTFQILNANAEYIDGDTYVISTLTY